MDQENLISFEDLDRARKILGLGIKATIDEIRQRYLSLTKQHHPDTGASREENAEEEENDIRRINEAYEIVLSYCQQYNYSFREDDFMRDQEHPILRAQRRFKKDVMWEE
jgi:DnaJ-class molecular chaperone